MLNSLISYRASPELIVIRSFDVNKPGEEVDNLRGGVAGGSVLRGVLKVGDQIEVRPGIVTKDKNGRVKCIPIFSRIVSLHAEQNDLQFAAPGDLVIFFSLFLFSFFLLPKVVLHNQRPLFRVPWKSGLERSIDSFHNSFLLSISFCCFAFASRY
jgi:hypothetical protein